MIKKFYLLPLFLLALSFAACNETEEPGKYDNWRERNEAFIDSLQQVYEINKGSDGLKRVQYSRDKKVYIYYKVLEKSPLVVESPVNTESPFYNSTVKMAYRGMYIDEKVFATAPSPYHYTKLYEALDVFDSNMKGACFNPEFDSPNTFSVNGVIGGWTELLQLMKPGDRFEVYIPYQAAYGETGGKDQYGNVTILGYSSLVFDMEMLDVVEY